MAVLNAIATTHQSTSEIILLAVFVPRFYTFQETFYMTCVIVFIPRRNKAWLGTR